MDVKIALTVEFFAADKFTWRTGCAITASPFTLMATTRLNIGAPRLTGEIFSAGQLLLFRSAST